ncbi:MAG: hypothetical protein ACPGQC_00465 [Limisphaerales bacterium]|jgi:hypothetical protein
MAGAMVISEWHVAYQPNSSGAYVSIRGRQAGLLSWILSILGVERGVRLEADTKHIKFKEGDMGGSSTRVIHLDSISSTYYGFKKPWAEAIVIIWLLGGALWGIGGALIGGTLGSLIGGIVAVGIAALYYFLNKRMTVGIVEHSGVQSQLVFKRSVLEGLKLDEASSAQASDVLQWLMDAARTGKAGPAEGTTQQGHI